MPQLSLFDDNAQCSLLITHQCQNYQEQNVYKSVPTEVECQGNARAKMPVLQKSITHTYYSRASNLFDSLWISENDGFLQN
jgi:hypothetical protein